MVVFGKKWLCSGKRCSIWQSGCIRVKVELFGQSVCDRRRWLYSGKMVLFE